MTALALALEIAAAVLGLILLPAIAVLLLQVAAYAIGSRRRAADDAAPASRRSSVTVLMPAHNEEAGIEHTLTRLMLQIAAGDRVLVIADNCSDRTATIARATGAEVIERAHATDRGKGFALAFGMDHLRSDPPTSVVILDADCILEHGALDALLAELARTGRPVQALYLMLAPTDAPLSRRLAQFAWRVRNWVRPAGWHRLGMPCQLMGTGMAFSWEMLQDAPLANASIVEDMKLGIDLAARGSAPIFCDRAVVTSQFPDSASASATQRTRWEHGHMETILREVPRMLRNALANRDRRMLGLALDLAVPPLALLAGLILADGILAIAATCVGAGPGVLLGAFALLFAFFATVLVAWAKNGRDLVGLVELLSIPWYILAKLPLYLRFIVRRQRDWVRTDRK